MDTTEISPWLLLATVTIAAVLLVLRLVRLVGTRWTVVFIVWSLGFFWLKETMQENHLLLDHAYHFSSDLGPSIGGVAIAIVIGHFAAFTLSFSLGLRLLRRASLPASAPLLATVVFAVAMAMGYMLEFGGVAAGWWYWGSGALPWWEDPDLVWMGELSFGIVSFERSSLGDVPACRLAGWPAGQLMYVTPVLVHRALSMTRASRFRHVGYLGIAPLMALVGVFDPSLVIVIVLIFGLGLLRTGDRPLFGSSPAPGSLRMWPWQRLARNADFLALGILFAAVCTIELSRGLQSVHLASWLPIAALVLMARWGSRVTIGSVVTLCCGLSISSYFIHWPAQWIVPFHVFYINSIFWLLPALGILALQRRIHRALK